MCGMADLRERLENLEKEYASAKAKLVSLEVEGQTIANEFNERQSAVEGVLQGIQGKIDTLRRSMTRMEGAMTLAREMLGAGEVEHANGQSGPALIEVVRS
jgi:predicted  nucleic acid-binding Zn-ribbon protein